MPRSFSWLVFALPLFACASVNQSHLPKCEPIEALPALPDSACLGDADTTAYRDRLRESMGSDVGSLFVRAILDESSRMRSLCTESTRVPGGWRADRNLSERLLEFAEIAGGPACLANRRLDLNRRAAKLAQMKRRRLECTVEMGTITKAGKGLVGPESATIFVESSGCLNQAEDWVVVNRGELRHPIIFAKPEVSDPPDVDASKIRRQCFNLHDFDDRASCITGHGWELLE